MLGRAPLLFLEGALPSIALELGVYASPAKHCEINLNFIKFDKFRCMSQVDSCSPHEIRAKLASFASPTNF
jgi:hypothetical protein